MAVCGLGPWDIAAVGTALALVLLMMFGWLERFLPIKNKEER